jgi:hypothetical protein
MYYRDEANRVVKANQGAGQVADLSEKELQRVHSAILQLRSDIFQVRVALSSSQGSLSFVPVGLHQLVA